MFRAYLGDSFTYQSGGQSFFFGYGGFNVNLFDPNIFIVTHGDVGGSVKFYQNAENPKTYGGIVNGTGQHQMWRIAGSLSTNVSTQRCLNISYSMWTTTAAYRILTQQ
jgi:hypothetical protein